MTRSFRASRVGSRACGWCIEDPHTGIVYEIERTLKGGSTQAEIYRQDQPETPIVQGTKQVTDYVARELTGLSHTAFVATFFTRQKELSFFGDLGATQRREQVGRLLGLETIRVAQKRIGEQRTRKHAESRVKREQYEEQSSGIDFPAEREQLTTVITGQTAQRDTARMTAAACKQETAIAAAARDQAQQRFAANAALRQELARLHGEIQRVEEMRNAAQRDLDRPSPTPSRRSSTSKSRPPASQRCGKRSCATMPRKPSSTNRTA